MIVSLVLLAGVAITPMRLPAASCILNNTPSEKACNPGCCANKTCCETSSKNTAPPVQPLAKSGSDHQNIATYPPTVAIVVLSYTTAESPVFSSAEFISHSPAPLALICIRLI
jgi:hypothetical protein